MSLPLDMSAPAVADLARALFGPENPRLSNSRELRFGRAGSLSVVPSRGVFANFETGATGGILDMVIHAGMARDRQEAAAYLDRGAVVVPGRRCDAARRAGAALRDAEAERDRLSRIAVAAALWASGTPLAGTVAETYLRTTRAVSAPLEAAALRFLVAAPLTPHRPDNLRAPALMAAVVNVHHQLTGVHVTYLRPDGSGKADILVKRKMVGVVRGGYIPLAPGAHLVVAEGVESAFSAWEALDGAAAGLGCIAAISAGGMSGLVWPDATEALTIAPDRDLHSTGEIAATTLARRAWAAGLTVGLLPPPVGFSDWNDAARAGRGRS